MTLLRPALSLLLWASLISFSVAASPEKNWIRIGDSAYAHKLYDSALSSYRNALSQDTNSAQIQSRLGNTHYRIGQIGEAVLSYEKALHLQPGYGPAAENLRVIQSNLMPSAEESDVFFLRWWKELTRAPLGNTWAILALLFFALPLILLTWSRWKRIAIAWLWPQWTLTGLLLSVAFAVLSFSSLNRPGLGTAVVMRPGTPFVAGVNSGTKSAPLSLPEGLIVRILREDKAGLLVSLADGRTGTIQPSDVAIVR